MKCVTLALASALTLSSAVALAQGGGGGSGSGSGSSGGSSAGTGGGSIGSATGSNSLSNGNTTNDTGGVPESNAQDAASRGHSGKVMGAINTLSNTTPASWLPIPAGDPAIKSEAYRAEIKEKLPRPKVQLGMGPTPAI
jgi:hypothetical protein